MTDDPLVRLRSRGRSSPSCAAACLTAQPGVLQVHTPDGLRELRTGPAGEVVRARFVPDRPDAGHVALLGPDGRACAVLAVADWVPLLVGVSPLSRGGAADDEELAWSGFDRLLDAAGVPVDEGGAPLDPRALVLPCGTSRPGLLGRAPLLLSLALVVWVVSLVVQAAAGDPWPQELALGLAALLSVALAGGALAARRSRRRTPPRSSVVRPSASTPVTPRFTGTARLVLVPGAAGTSAVVVQDSLEVQEWFDGPAAPLGLRRAHVVTPRGHEAPERVDLVDGLGREVVRLPWAQWFGGRRGQAGLQALRDAGLVVVPTAGPAVGPELLQLSSSLPHAGGLVELEHDSLAAFGPGLLLAGLPLLVGLQGGGSRLTVALAVVVAVLVVGPQVVPSFARAWYDRPRAPR